jgi:hypothetical protein
MKSLLSGCAAAALFAGLTGQAHAQIEVREAPVYAAPADAAAPPTMTMTMAPAAPTPDAAESAQAAPSRVESQVVKALVAPPKPAPTLTPDENAFFAVLGRRVTDAASAYESYVRRATAIDPRFADAAAVQKAVRTGAAYQPQQLQEGIVAYAALLALRNQDFVDGVRNIRDPAFADRLTASPQAVLSVRGADLAAADVAGALRAQGAALLAAGKSITQAAYDVQAQPWSKAPVSDPQGVLAEAKDAAVQPRAASVPAKQRLLDSLVAPNATPVANTASGAPDVVRGLALAALAIMGRTGDGKEPSFESLLHDATSADCLKMAKMNLNQCLAVAGPQYEDVYCTGRHAVGETASCVSAAANGAGSALPAPAPVQLQRAEGYGPEQARAYGRPGLQPQDQDDDDDSATAATQRYASVQPSYKIYTVPAAPPQAQAPQPTYADSRQAGNDGGYGQPPYADQRGYAQPAPQYPAQQYTEQQYQAPQYQQPAPTYPAPPQYQPPQPAYQGQPYTPYPYGYAGQGYNGQ